MGTGPLLGENFTSFV